MINDKELWVFASKVLEAHGGNARQFLAARIEDLSRKGDNEGVKTTLAIQRRLERLLTLYTEETRH